MKNIAELSLCFEPANIEQCGGCLRNPKNTEPDAYWQSWIRPDVVESDFGSVCKFYLEGTE